MIANQSEFNPQKLIASVCSQLTLFRELARNHASGYHHPTLNLDSLRP